ncbi:IS21 family transposase, partial [Alicyclobacillus suci]|uniref:IS21 family transposase n=1 Tax=Alicyclobacillus suci TaxID=2816080 RepID=UPI001A8DC845
CANEKSWMRINGCRNIKSFYKKERLSNKKGLTRFNCVAMKQRLEKMGYTGGVTQIKAFVHPHRPPRQVQAKRRYETKPGQQAQIDWGFCEEQDENGRTHKVAVFVMVLGYSRSIYVEFTRRCDIHSFLRCFIHALEHFGGVPKFGLTDHMKTVVIGRNDDGTPKWHPLFEDFVLTVGLTPKLCRVRVPQTKGKVERGVGFVKDNFWPGRRFTGMADLNRQALTWCQEQDRRIHGTTGERPWDLMQDEQLNPLPSPDRLQKFLREERKVSMDGFVSWDGVRYGVPWRYSGRTVLVRQVGKKIEIWAEGECIATHERSDRWSGLIRLPNQYEGLDAAEGRIAPKAIAVRVAQTDVEQRPLEVYEQFALGVGAC